jgi:hypothetical protein
MLHDPATDEPPAAAPSALPVELSPLPVEPEVFRLSGAGVGPEIR